MAEPRTDPVQAPASKRRCGQCEYFTNSPTLLEAAFPGLAAMSSGSASVRNHDGLCQLHDRYLSYFDTCPDFKISRRIAAEGQESG